MILLFLLAASLGPASYQRANEMFQQRQFRQAGEALDQAIREDPGFVPSWTLRGKIAGAYGRFDMAAGGGPTGAARSSPACRGRHRHQ